MPVILEPEQWKKWLEAGSPDAVKLLVPSDDDKLAIYPVSTKVNNPQGLYRRGGDRSLIEQRPEVSFTKVALL